MTNRSREQLEFPGCKGRKVEVDFSGGDVTSDGGVLLLRQADRRIGLTARVAGLLGDERRKASCGHDQLSMLRQRVYGLARGYEDLNDHGALRAYPAIQTSVDKDTALASAPTLCRWENRAGREAAAAIHQVLVDNFLFQAGFQQSYLIAPGREGFAGHQFPHYRRGEVAPFRRPGKFQLYLQIPGVLINQPVQKYTARSPPSPRPQI